MSAAGNDLVGQFFRIFDEEGSGTYVGQISGRSEPGYYFCRLVDCMGERSCAKLAHISQMSLWSFYSSEDEWRDACQANKNHSGALCGPVKDVPINDVFSRRSETER